MSAPGTLDTGGLVMAQHGRTFAWASRLLGRREARLAHMLYSFCRYVDDLADESEDSVHAHAELSRLHQALANPTSQHPWAQALHGLHRDYGLRLEPARDLVAGVREDLERATLRDEAALLNYCYKVAGTVGLMMCDVFQVRHRQADHHAVELGIAMQLTNIARDVQEDAHNGRIYLPSSWRRGVDAGSIARAQPETRPQVQSAIACALRLADEHYQRARAGYGYLPVRARMAVAVAARCYRQIGVRLAAKQHAFWRGRTVVPQRQKWRLAGTEMLRLILPTELPGASPDPVGQSRPAQRRPRA